MKDETLRKMADHLLAKYSGDEIISDITNKKNLDIASLKSNPEAFKTFMEDVEAWSNESKRGLVCGIFGCTNPPDWVCKYCFSSYCSRDRSNHLHALANDGLIDDEDFHK